MRDSYAIQEKSRERGFTILFYALVMFVVIGFAGLAVDTGYMQWTQRRIQAAADAGAMGALREMELGRTNSSPANDLTLTAQNDASLNGFTNGVDGVTVTLNNPPTSGTYSGVGTAAQVVVSKVVPTYFMRMFATNSAKLSAQAVAQTTTSSGSIGGCIYAVSMINANKQDAINSSGGFTISTSCSAIDESAGSQALGMSGGTTWNFISSSAHVGVLGGYSISGGAKIYNAAVTPKVSENPVTLTTSPGDPLANVATPTTSNVSVTVVRSTKALSYTSSNMPTGNSLNPGVYCGGITMSGGAPTITFQPGVYILAGGGLNVSGGASMTGTGVMFYNTTSSWGALCSSSFSAKNIQISGGGSMVLSAPTSGTWAGMLFYEDRSLSSALVDTLSGGSTSSFDGALYFKKDNLNFSGGNSTNGYMVLVADSITFSGGATIGNNYTTLSDPNPFAPYTTGGGLVQ